MLRTSRRELGHGALAEKALKAARAANESQSSTTSSEHSSEAKIESSIAKLEEYLVKTSEKFEKEMMHFMADSSCAAKTNNTTKCHQNGILTKNIKQNIFILLPLFDDVVDCA